MLTTGIAFLLYYLLSLSGINAYDQLVFYSPKGGIPGYAPAELIDVDKFCETYGDGKYPDINSHCEGFIACLPTGAFVFRCAPGTVYDPSLGVCNFPFRSAGCSLSRLPFQPITEKPSTPKPQPEKPKKRPQVKPNRPQRRPPHRISPRPPPQATLNGKTIHILRQEDNNLKVVKG